MAPERAPGRPTSHLLRVCRSCGWRGLLGLSSCARRAWLPSSGLANLLVFIFVVLMPQLRMAWPPGPWQTWQAWSWTRRRPRTCSGCGACWPRTSSSTSRCGCRQAAIARHGGDDEACPINVIVLAPDWASGHALHVGRARTRAGAQPWTPKAASVQRLLPQPPQQSGRMLVGTCASAVRPKTCWPTPPSAAGGQGGCGGGPGCPAPAAQHPGGCAAEAEGAGGAAGGGCGARAVRGVAAGWLPWLMH